MVPPRRARRLAPRRLALGVVLAGRDEVRGILPWLGTGILLGLILSLANEWVFRDRLHLVPMGVAGFLCLERLRQALCDGFAGAVPANLLALAITLLAGWGLMRWLAMTDRPAPQRHLLPPANDLDRRRTLDYHTRL